VLHQVSAHLRVLLDRRGPGLDGRVAGLGRGGPSLFGRHQLFGCVGELLAAGATHEQGDGVRLHHRLVHHRVVQRVRAAGPFDGDDGGLEIGPGERAIPAVGAASNDVQVTPGEDAGGKRIAMIVRNKLVVGPRVHVEANFETAVGCLVARQPIEQERDAAGSQPFRVVQDFAD
jgi:hypothetical protein